jgi:hypothetical protein
VPRSSAKAGCTSRLTEAAGARHARRLTKRKPALAGTMVLDDSAIDEALGDSAEHPH